MFLCVLLQTSPSLDAQQVAGIDEVRVSSREYVPQPAYKLRAEATLVEVGVTVRDSHGRAVSGLAKNNFQLFDEGRQREIVAFSVEGGAPVEAGSTPAAAATRNLEKKIEPVREVRYMGLYFDDVNTRDSSMAADLKRTQAAAERFVNDGLQPGVIMAVLTASGTQALDFTSDAAKLIATIQSIRAHPRTYGRKKISCPEITPYRAYRVAHDRDFGTLKTLMVEAALRKCPMTRDQAILLAEDAWRESRETSADTLKAIGHAVSFLAQAPGSRSLLLASSGFMSETLKEEQDRIVDQALRAGIVINALDSKGLFTEVVAGSRPFDQGIETDPRIGGSVKDFDIWVRTEESAVTDRIRMMNASMAELTASTGGAFYHDNNDLHAGFHELSAPPEVSYRLSFRPEVVAANRGYHRLKVKLVGAKPHSIEARPGYLAPAADAFSADALEAKLDREVAGQDTQAEFPLGIAVRDGKLATGGAALSVLVEVDISKMKFRTQGDRRTQKITFVSALLDSQGKVVAGKMGTMELALKSETYDRLAKTGLSATITLQAPPGSYSLREVAEEAVDGKLACSSHFVQIR